MPKGHLHVTIDEDLLQHLDRTIAPSGPFRTRSAAVEGALRLWLRRQLDAEIEAYYGGQGQEQAAEDQQWSEAAAGALFQSLDEREPAGRRPAAKKPRRR